MSMRGAWYDLGQIEYLRAWDFQKHMHGKVSSGELEYALITCRHLPVITLGRQARKENILASDKELLSAGIAVHAVQRGGDVTYHGPGQLTLYPVLNLAYFRKDLRWYLRTLEEMVMDFLSGFGVAAERHEGRTGVWVGQCKIASIGVAVSKWISFHGVSINIKAEDLAGYGLIRPCGMDIRMTSLESQIKRDVGFDCVHERLHAAFMRSFQVGQEDTCVSDFCGVTKQ